MKSRLRYTTIGTLSIIWLNIVIPLFKDAMVYGPTIFPKTPINQLEVLKLTASSLLLAFSLFFQGLDARACLQKVPKNDTMFFVWSVDYMRVRPH